MSALVVVGLALLRGLVFDYDLIRTHAPLIVDSRNAIKGTYPHVFKLGAPSRA